MNTLPAQETIRYDHFGQCPRVAADAPEPAGCKKRLQINLEPGEPFSIIIARTTRTEFSYSVAGLEVPPSDAVETQGAAVPTDTVVLRQIHDDRFGGYVVRIRHANPDLPSGNLGEATLTIRVTSLGWKVGFGGGFTTSGLTDGKFAVVPDTSEGASEESVVIRRDEEREDDVALGIATFVDLHHTKLPWAAFSFGLGVNASSGFSYYVGLSHRFGNQGSLTGGLALGGVETLPAGEMEGRAPSNPNVLNNLGSKTKASWFVAVSYSFLGGGAADLNKPFLDPTAFPAASGAGPRGANGNGRTEGDTETNGGGEVVDDDAAGGTDGMDGSAAPDRTIRLEGARCVEGTPSNPPRDPLTVTLLAGDPPEPVPGEELQWSVGLAEAGELRAGSVTGESVTTETDAEGRASVQIVSVNDDPVEIVVSVGEDEDTAEVFSVSSDCP